MPRLYPYTFQIRGDALSVIGPEIDCELEAWVVSSNGSDEVHVGQIFLPKVVRNPNGPGWVDAGWQEITTDSLFLRALGREIAAAAMDCEVFCDKVREVAECRYRGPANSPASHWTHYGRREVAA